MYNGSITANAVTPSVNMKNRIINGAMVISQRNGTSAVTLDGASAYTLDRWEGYDATDGSFSVQQTTTAPTGFNNSLKVTVVSTDTSLGATQFAFLRQKIEGYNVADLGWGTANAKTITLSFWVYSSVTGTFGGAFVNDNGDRGYPFSYTISAANTWEQKSVTLTGDTTGTWLTTNGVGIGITFGLGVGSSYSGTAGSWQAGFYASATGATNLMATSGATFYITGCQLEIGSTATSFDYRPYGTELQLCQRYFWVWNSTGVSYAKIGYGVTDTANRMEAMVYTPTVFRANPTITSTAASTFRVAYYSSYGGAQNVTNGTSIGFDTATTSFFRTYVATGASFNQGVVGFIDAGGTNPGDSRIYVSAEL
jgi:hypothetical protein